MGTSQGLSQQANSAFVDFQMSVHFRGIAPSPGDRILMQLYDIQLHPRRVEG